jgi:hypothetical protein
MWTPRTPRWLLRNRRARQILGGSALVVTLFGLAWVIVPEPSPPDPLALRVVGCPPLPRARPPDAPVRTATQVIERQLTRGRPLLERLERLSRSTRWAASHPEVHRFRSRETGLEVSVHSDGDVVVDRQAFDDTVALMFRHAAAADDPQVAALWGCYAIRTGKGELAGRQLRLVVPADPGACFNDLAITRPQEGNCDARGLALPTVDLRPQAALVGDVARLEFPATAFVTAGRSDHAAEQVAAEVLLHELVHVLDNAFGIPGEPGRWESYERRAYAVQGIVKAATGSLPRSVRYPGTRAPTGLE